MNRERERQRGIMHRHADVYFEVTTRGSLFSSLIKKTVARPKRFARFSRDVWIIQQKATENETTTLRDFYTDNIKTPIKKIENFWALLNLVERSSPDITIESLANSLDSRWGEFLSIFCPSFNTLDRRALPLPSFSHPLFPFFPSNQNSAASALLSWHAFFRSI